jgi:hypothetical protein
MPAHRRRASFSTVPSPRSSTVPQSPVPRAGKRFDPICRRCTGMALSIDTAWSMALGRERRPSRSATPLGSACSSRSSPRTVSTEFRGFAGRGAPFESGVRVVATARGILPFSGSRFSIVRSGMLWVFRCSVRCLPERLRLGCTVFVVVTMFILAATSAVTGIVSTEFHGCSSSCS